MKLDHLLAKSKSVTLEIPLFKKYRDQYRNFIEIPVIS